MGCPHYRRHSRPAAPCGNPSFRLYFSTGGSRLLSARVNLSVTTRELQHATVVDLSGRIVFGDEANLLRDKVKKIIVDQRRPVVLNLRNVSYIDSAGVGTLVGLYTSAHAAGTELRLACPSPKVEHVLKITKLLPILGAYPDETSALCACDGKSAIA